MRKQVREFKFRAWDSYHQEMINWSQYKDELVSEDFINHGKGPLVVMQYAGLKDMNGKEIYEGDIVIVGEGNWTCKVYYSDIMQAFMLKDLDFKHRESLNYMSQFSAYKVIGNIHENKEVLEGKTPIKEREVEKETLDKIIHKPKEIQTNAEDAMSWADVMGWEDFTSWEDFMSWIEEAYKGSWDLINDLEDIIIDLEE